MSSTQTVSIDGLRSLAFGSISSSYAAIGGIFQYPVRVIRFVNNTNGDVFLSDDAVNNKIFLSANSFLLIDCNTNRLENQVYWVFPSGTQFYVKQSSAPTVGSVYLECYYSVYQ